VKNSISVSEKQKPLYEKEAEISIETDKIDQSATETNECKHYFGYLSERTKKEVLPEECMLCGKIVQCMLKNIAQ